MARGDGVECEEERRRKEGKSIDPVLTLCLPLHDRCA